LICYYAARRKERGDGASLAICTQPREEEFLERRYIDMLACLFAVWSGLVKQTACSGDEGRREEKSRDCGGPSILVARAEQNAPAVRPSGEPWASPSSCGRKQVRSWRRNLHLLDSSYHRQLDRLPRHNLKDALWTG